MSARRVPRVLSWSCVFVFALLILPPAVFHGAPEDSGHRVLRTMKLGGEGGWKRSRAISFIGPLY